MPAVTEDGKVPIRIEDVHGGEPLAVFNERIRRGATFIANNPNTKGVVKVACVLEMRSAVSDTGENFPTYGWKVDEAYPSFTGRQSTGVVCGDQILITREKKSKQTTMWDGDGNLATLPQQKTQGEE